MTSPKLKDNSFSIPDDSSDHPNSLNFRLVEFVLIQNNIFSCHFLNKDEMMNVLNTRPWNFKDSLIILCLWDRECVFDDLEFAVLRCGSKLIISHHAN